MLPHVHPPPRHSNVDAMRLFKGLRFGGRLALLAAIIILLTVAFWMSLRHLRASMDRQEELMIQRRILHHPRILQPPLKTVTAENGTAKEIARNLAAKFAIPLHMDLGRPAWDVASSWLKPREIMPEHAPELGTIIHKLSTGRIVGADFGYKGTQLKLSLMLEGGQRVAFKPRWYARDFIILGKPFAGADRHNGEIASFHLNRILGFRRAPIVAGRKVNLRNEIIPNATPALLKTFFQRGNNTCFYGRCYYCKGEEDGVCAKGDVLEGTVVLWLPPGVELKNHRHPWGRTYREGVLAKWETDANYCKKVLNLWPYKDFSDEMLDVMDAAIFDFLIGNADRHNYETMNDQPNKRGLMLLLDNAKSFGNPFHDERSILAPILQCCKLRRTTYDRLALLQHGVLGDVMKQTLSRDRLQPILFEQHYLALDRRLKAVMEILTDCIQANLEENVLVNELSYR